MWIGLDLNQKYKLYSNTILTQLIQNVFARLSSDWTDTNIRLKDYE